MVDAEKEYTISEVAEITDYPTHVLRYYEKEFELDIPRNNSNHRYYTYKEIEAFNYIKSLQEKGFTNKQIKLIMNSPEMLVTDQEEETAVTSLIKKNSTEDNTITELTTRLQDFIVNEIKPTLIERENTNLQAINELREEIHELKQEIRSQERDVLISENARLKMKVKERAYEVADLKEKVKRQQYNKGVFKRIFKK